MPPRGGPRPGRIIGVYALAVMEAEGPLYGYRLADRIADRTDGAWRPGAGAVYPALESLARQRYARASAEGRRRVYRITSLGQSHLREIRRNMTWRTRSGPDLIQLWAEIAGSDDPGLFLVESVRRRLDSVLAYFARSAAGPERNQLLRKRLMDELRRAEERLAEDTQASGRPRPGRARRRPAA